DRPPAFSDDGTKELYQGQPLVHFNEVDECAGVDALVTNHVWNALGFDPSTTLHDVRWGEHYHGEGLDEFVWLLQISGAAPPNHFVGGFASAVSERQPAMYFPLGGGSLKGISRPGEIVWSRVFVEDNALHVDLGRGSAVSLPAQETERRWRGTTYQWPLMHAVFHGVDQNQFMARHRANHVNVAYAPSSDEADKALAVKAAMMHELGLIVHLCGETSIN
ncbi:MAG: fucose isomerase, partial [Edaphobacter sp.]